jgi:hypothetical protein
VKTGSIRIGARHAWLQEQPDKLQPDKQMRAGALRPDPALLLPVLLLPVFWMSVIALSVIAGMAHSTLESGAATRNGVAFEASTEDSTAIDWAAT